jgi:hypothetical protein
MTKQKVRTKRRNSFSGVKAYIGYVEVLKKRCNAVGLTFCDAILNSHSAGRKPAWKSPDLPW